MNNKDKYIIEVDALTAGDEIKKSILQLPDKKKKKSVYKKIIPIAACIVIAVTVALPGFLFRAGNAKDAAQEVVYDAEFENAAAVQNEESLNAKSESGGYYADELSPDSSVEPENVTVQKDGRTYTLNSELSDTVKEIILSARDTAQYNKKIDLSGDNGITIIYSESRYIYYPDAGIITSDEFVSTLDSETKNALNDILEYSAD
ncbi:MAG: hypothetical protein IJ050_11545 [Clostridia bacterium]|nr:hypothetical protein [Clostridia bacterium]